MRSTLPLSRRGPAPSIAPGVRKRAGRGPTTAPVGFPEGARVLDTAPDSYNRLRRASARSLRHGLALVLFAIAAIWLLAASRWIVTDTVVPWDAKNQFYAFFRFLATAIHSGQAPFWNPYHYGGHPSVADPQSLVFSPPFVLWALFDAAPSIRAFDLIVYAHLAAGGLAVGAMGWRAGWPAAASILAAAIFMFGGPASGRLQHTGIILSYGLFPVALLLHADGAAAPLDDDRGALSASLPRSSRLAATTRPCCCASSSPPRSRPRSSRPGTAGATCTSGAPCWRRWASSRLRWWRCRCC